VRFPTNGLRSSRLHSKRTVAVLAGVTVVLAAFLSATLAGVFGGRPAAAAAPSATRGPGPVPRSTAPADSSVGEKTPGSTTGSAAGMTSCTSVAHIGDSTSVGMVSAQSLPDPAQRLAAQYRDVGVQHVRIDASGGRSIVEELPGQLNGDVVGTNWYQQGYRGCWVFALGTNDTANVAAGSNIGLSARIAEMMAAAHGEPVMWVNTQTDLSAGPWSEANMRAWNSALAAACHTYPNMRIFDWASMVQPSWHLADGIHYTSAGYAIRAHAIAAALAKAFPAGGRSSGCVVSS
jgi:hypothetical protein